MSVAQSLKFIVHVAKQSALSDKWYSLGNIDAFTRIYFIEFGQCWVTVWGRRYNLAKNDLIFIPANSRYAYGCAKQVNISWIHLDVKIFGGIDFFERFEGPPRVTRHDPDDTRRCLRSIRDRFGVTAPSVAGDLNMQSALFHLLSLYAASAVERSDRINDKRFAPVLAHIEQRLSDDLAVTELARLAHLEKSYFSTLFKKVFGDSPKAYILGRRIEAARGLLLSTNMNLEAIARQVGFWDAFHLSRTFKRIVGVSPRQYLQDARRRTP